MYRYMERGMSVPIVRAELQRAQRDARRCRCSFESRGALEELGSLESCVKGCLVAAAFGVCTTRAIAANRHKFQVDALFCLVLFLSSRAITDFLIILVRIQAYFCTSARVLLHFFYHSRLADPARSPSSAGAPPTTTTRSLCTPFLRRWCCVGWRRPTAARGGRR
jgi:hypothetical protein